MNASSIKTTSCFRKLLWRWILYSTLALALIAIVVTVVRNYDPVVSTKSFPERTQRVTSTVSCSKGVGMCGLKYWMPCPGKQPAVFDVVPIEQTTRKGKQLWDERRILVETQGKCE